MLRSKSTSNTILVVALVVLIMFYNNNVIPSLATTYNVMDFGAKPDGKTDSTDAFLRSWAAACGLFRRSSIYVPPGRYLVQKMQFNDKNCNITAVTFLINGTLVAPLDSRVIGNAESWITFKDVQYLSIVGGVLEGHGATTLGFFDSNKIAISGLTSLNSKTYHIVINGCHDVTLDGVNVLSSGSPNAYGVHVQLTSEMNITSSRLCTGDNCISIGPDTIALLI